MSDRAAHGRRPGLGFVGRVSPRPDTRFVHCAGADHAPHTIRRSFADRQAAAGYTVDRLAAPRRRVYGGAIAEDAHVAPALEAAIGEGSPAATAVACRFLKHPVTRGNPPARSPQVARRIRVILVNLADRGLLFGLRTGEGRKDDEKECGCDPVHVRIVRESRAQIKAGPEPDQWTREEAVRQ